jgi:hypothetical protein
MRGCAARGQRARVGDNGPVRVIGGDAEVVRVPYARVAQHEVPDGAAAVDAVGGGAGLAGDMVVFQSLAVSVIRVDAAIRVFPNRAAGNGVAVALAGGTVELDALQPAGNDAAVDGLAEHPLDHLRNRL